MYMSLGTQAAVARNLGIDDSVISRWTKTEWWADTERELANQIEAELKAKLRTIAMEGSDLAIEAIRNKELKGTAIMTTAAIAIDKVRLLENKATTISASTQGIQAKLESLSRQLEARTVSTQTPSESVPEDTHD